MYRDRDDSETAHFGGQAVQQGEWVDFPPSPEEPSRVPSVLLSALRYFGSLPGFDRTMAGFSARR